MFQAITNHDLPAIQGVLLVFALGQLVMSLLVDLTYGYLNPRIRVAWLPDRARIQQIPARRLETQRRERFVHARVNLQDFQLGI